MKRYLGTLIILSLAMLNLGATVAQEVSERSGIIVILDEETLGGRLDDLITVIPSEWLTSTENMPRYELHIVPTVRELPDCVYNYTVRVRRMRIDIVVHIIDLETSEPVIDRSFAGRPPINCPTYITVRDGYALPEFLGLPSRVDFGAWINEILTATGDSMVVGNPHRFPLAELIISPDPAMTSASYSTDGLSIVTSDGIALQIWDVTTGQARLQLIQPLVVAAAYNPDGSMIVAINSDGTTQLYDAATGTELYQLIPDTFDPRPVEFGSGNNVSFSPDSRAIATVHNDGPVRIWEAATGHELLSLSIESYPADWLTSASFCSDGRTIVTGDTGGVVRVWDFTTGQVMFQFLIGNRIWGVECSPDSRNTITVTDANIVELWDIATGQKWLELAGHERLVRSAHYSPNGRYILTASNDGTARLWDASSGQEIEQFQWHLGPVVSAKFSPDGNYIVTASEDGTAVIWNVSDLTSSQ